MAINSFKTGPGSLKLGTGGSFDVSAQVRTVSVNPSENIEEEDDLPVLSGETLEGVDEVTYDWTLSGTFLQDMGASGVVDYTWTNKGTVVDFEFIPNDDEDQMVTGQVRVTPISVGGEVKARATSDFEWAIIGTPVLAAVA